MSFKNRYPSPLVLLFLVLTLLITQIACSDYQRTAVTSLGAAISAEVDESLQTPDDLVFAGQISDASGLWQNDFVVVLFKNGEEVARTYSRLLDSPLSGLGPMDGVFELRFKNEYKLTTDHEFLQGAAPLSMRPVNGMVGQAYIGSWFHLTPNSFLVIDVPDKQLKYTLVVLAMSLNEVPPSHQRGNLAFDNGRLLINQQQNQQNLVVENVAEMTTAVQTIIPTPTPIPPANIQLNLLPSRNNGQDWHLQLTGYYGNRWDVWEKYVAGRGVGMSWDTFKEVVLVYNPHLETDGFVFYPNKAYLLPTTQ